MTEQFYQLYKSMRDMVEDMRHKELNEHTRQFVYTQESICKNYDKRNPDCYKRWLQEWKMEYTPLINKGLKDMNPIEDINDHFCRDDNWWGSFDCPNCNQAWGPSNHGDPPGEVDKLVKCDCGATLNVSGQLVSHYEIDAEIMDDE